MPYYAGLWPHATDSEQDKLRKRKIAEDLERLRTALADHFKAHRDGDVVREGCVRIGTWNLRDFGKEHRGERLEEAIYFIAEIISNFDVVALQEVYRDLRAFTRLRRVLGSGWDFIMTDATTSTRGNDERMVFLFKTSAVHSTNLAGEISLADDKRLMLPNSFDYAPDGGPLLRLPPGGTIAQPNPSDVHYKSRSNNTKLDQEVVLNLPSGAQVTLPDGAELVFKGDAADLKTDSTFDLKSGADRQFGAGAYIRIPPQSMFTEDLNLARSPFLVGFQSRWLRFSLCTTHIYYGSNDAGLKLDRREEEIRHLAQALGDKASDAHDSDASSFFLLLGDFNIVGHDHGTMAALETSGFKVPKAIRTLPKGSNVAGNKFYDQIAVWEGEPGREIRMRDYASIAVAGAGVFDYYDYVFREGAKDPGGVDEAYYKQRMQEQVDTGKAGQVYAQYKDWRTYHMSDHLPMWLELRTDFADDYLGQALKALGAQ